uniref:Proline-rich protein PRCC n=1 Tax=Caenorhabditis japonica TaxID=281687 RepID=A0A8R1HYE9_CAEJA
MGLVDYDGSESDSDQEEIPQKIVQAPIVSKTETIMDDDAFFHDNQKNGGSQETFNPAQEDALEDIVKPKKWELKLAEKAKRKLEKKAMKKELKKEKKLAKKAKKSEKIAKVAGGIQKKEKTKIVISALGSLSGIAEGRKSSDESDDEEKEDTGVEKQKMGNGFLASLPAPKGRNNRSDAPVSFAKSLIPSSVAKSAPPISKPVPAPKVMNYSDDDDDDDEPTDFFGFSSAPAVPKETSSDSPFMAINSSMDVVGPSRPTEDDDMDVSQMYPNVEDEEEEQTTSSSTTDGWLHRKISDEQAHKLLMKFSHDIGPEERRSINEMASSIVDVNVDAALGPDVKQNILKNLGHRAFVESTKAPMPTVQTQGQMSRRKHQITYLASQAVAREEQLKDQWADQKQNKRMARQKYGF